MTLLDRPSLQRESASRDTPAVPREDPMSTAFYYFVGIVSWPVLRLLYRLRWRGRKTSRRAGSFSRPTTTSELRSLAARIPAVAQAPAPLDGEVGLFNPVLGPILRRGGLSRSSGDERPRGHRARDRARSRGRRRRHVPRGDAPEERPAQSSARRRTPAQRESRSWRRSRSYPPRSSARTGSPGSVRCESPTAPRALSTISANTTTERQRRSRPNG